MPGAEQLRVRLHDVPHEGTCLLCGQTSHVVTIRSTLYRGQVAVGVVCQDCVETSPRVVARRIRQRAADSRRLADRAGHELTPPLRNDAVRLFREHASRLQSLARGVQQLPGWRVEHVKSDAVNRLPASP